MSTYAVLGSTGNVGSSIIKILLQSPEKKIHAYCRSRQKLLNQQPDLDTNPNVRIFEGSMDDKTLLKQCFQGTRAVIVAVAVTGNQPGTTIAQDTARHVIAALRELRDEQRDQRLPRVLVLSSASTEHRLMSEVSPFLRNMLYRALQNIYDDLKAGEALYRAEEDWLTSVFIKPGALTHDAQKGHELSMDKAGSPVSFLDLAAGMVEVAEADGSRFDGKAVAVNATSKDVAFPRDAPFHIARGLIVHFFPWAYRWVV